MDLSNELLSQFAKVTNDNKKDDNKETTVYGKVVKYDGAEYVQLDGSELLTPVVKTTATKDGERVTVRIKNHRATITGNISSPSASSSDVDDLNHQIAEFDTIVAEKASIGELEAQIARIDHLTADTVIVKDTLIAANAEIENLTAENANITGMLTASNAEIDNLKANKLDAGVANITYATITELDATNANVVNLEATYADFEIATADKFSATDASIKNLEANKLSAESANIKYAQIDFANIGKAAMEYFYAKSGLIENVVVGDQNITGMLCGVTIKGDLIEGNTVVADKLVIKGDDGLYYKLNTDGMKVETEQTDYNSLNGSIITAKSITATKINVQDLVAFDATIGGFKITDDSIYSGVKETVNNTTRGIYLDNDGQIAFGDSSNYVKFFKDDDGSYRLNISADKITFKNSDEITSVVNSAVEDAIKDSETVNGIIVDTVGETINESINEALNGIEIGGRNLLQGTSDEWKDIKVAQYVGYINSGRHHISEYGLKVGDTVTFSAELQAINKPLRVRLSKYEFESEGTASSVYGQTIPVGETGFSRLTTTLQWEYIAVFIANNDTTITSTTTEKYRNTKLEKGSIPTDWSPAPEDIDSSIQNVQNQVSLNKSSIDLMKDEIALKVESTDITEAINNVEIGGRNLLKKNTYSIYYSDNVTKEGDYKWVIPQQEGYASGIKIDSGLLEVGKSYVLSYKYQKISGDLIKIGGHCQHSITKVLYDKQVHSNSSYSNGITAAIDNNIHEIQVYFVVRDDVNDKSVYIQINRNNITVTEPAVVAFWDIQLEEGNKATKWTPPYEDTDSKIKNVQTQVSQNKSSIDVLNNKIELKVESTDITEAIDNIQIGSRNLVKNTGVTTGWHQWVDDRGTLTKNSTSYKLTSTAASQNAICQYFGSFVMEKDKQYTFQALVKGNVSILEIYLIKPTGVTGSNQRIIYQNPNTTINTTSWTKIVETFTLKHDWSPGVIFIGGTFGAVGEWVEVKNCSVKVEEGNKATTWTKAPEDIDADISTIETQVTTNKSSITTLNNQIALKVESNDVHTIISQTDFNNLCPNSNWEVGPNGWKLSHVESGNFYYGPTSGVSIEDKHYIRVGHSTNNSVAALWADSPKFVVAAGEKLTLGGIVASTSNAITNLYILFTNNTSDITTDNSYITTDYASLSFTSASYTKKTITHTVPTGATRAFVRIRVAKTDTTINTSSTAVFTSIMVSRGEKALRWTPSVQDSVLYTKAQITNVNSSITQLSDQIALKVNTTTMNNTLQNYATTSSLTLTKNELIAAFEATGGINLIENSTGYGSTRRWTKTAAASIATAGAGSNKALPCGKYMYLQGTTATTEMYAWSTRFKLKANTTYTLSGWMHNYTRCKSFDVYVLVSDSRSYTDTTTNYDKAHIPWGANLNTGGSWKYYSASFTTGASAISGLIRIDNNGYNASGTSENRVHWCGLILNEGSEAPWTPHPSEVYNGYTTIDGSGVTITNGALTIKNNDGTTVLSGDSNGDLTLYGSLITYTGNGDSVWIGQDSSKIPIFASSNPTYQTGAFIGTKLIVSNEYTAWSEGKAISQYTQITPSSITTSSITTDGNATFGGTTIHTGNTYCRTNLFLDKADTEQQIRFQDSSSSSWTAGLYKGASSSSTVVGLYDWTNSLSVWAYNNAKNFVINRPAYLPSNTYINSTAVMSVTTANNNTSIRFYNGIQICYANVSWTDKTLSKMADAVYSQSAINAYSMTFAQAFAAMPTVTTNCIGSAYLNSHCASATTTTAIFRVWTNYAATPTGMYFQFVAVGKWK